MPDDIKLTLDQPVPQTPTLTLEGVEAPSLTLTPEEPAPKQVEEDDISTLDESVLSPEERKVVDDFAQKIDLTNSTLVLQYGSAAQKKIASFSDTTLNNVRTKDLGEVGDQISNLVVELKGFDIEEEEKKGFFGFFKNAGNKLTAMKARYDTAEQNVNKIVGALEAHQVQLMKDIVMLDNMPPEDMAEAVRLTRGRAETECSGNVTKENIARLTKLGVDYISSGALTHSAPILDVSMKNLHPVD